MSGSVSVSKGGVRNWVIKSVSCKDLVRGIVGGQMACETFVGNMASVK